MKVYSLTEIIVQFYVEVKVLTAAQSYLKRYVYDHIC